MMHLIYRAAEQPGINSFLDISVPKDFWRHGARDNVVKLGSARNSYHGTIVSLNSFLIPGRKAQVH